MEHRKRENVRIVLLLLLCVVVFARVVTFDFVNFDDDLFVASTAVAGWGELSWWERLTTPHIGYPVPVPLAIYALVSKISGFDAGSFHVVSLLLHLVNTTLVWAVGRRLGLDDGLAVVAAGVWAVHPVQAESVAWVTCLKELTTGLGLLGVIYGALRLDEGARWWVAVFAGAVVALGSKPTGVIAGPLLLAVLLVKWKFHGERIERAGWAAVAALVGAGVSVSIVAFQMHDAHGGHLEANGLSMAAQALYLQLQHVLVPVGLGPRYGAEAPLAVAIVVAGTALALGGWTALRGWRRHETAVVVGLALALGAWLPVSNIVPLRRFTADSYMYLPLAGLCWAAFGLAQSRFGPLTRRSGAIAAVVLLGCSAWTFSQLGTWKNGISLWTRAAVTAPERDADFVLMKLGQAHAMYQNWDEAIAFFESADQRAYGTALPFPPRWPEAYAAIGNRDRAEELYELGLARLRANNHSARHIGALEDSFDAFRGDKKHERPR